MDRTPLTWTLALALLASACAGQKPLPAREVTEAPAAPPSQAVEATAAPAQPVLARCVADADCASSELCVASTCRPITPDLAECTTAVARFSFDQSTLQEEDLPGLQRTARCLASAPGLRLTVEGHADERGTTMYNLALGNRRAAAVERYLVSLGAASTQIRTVSYGKERPACHEHAERCWAQNRRARIERGF
jgi:peptidoglycan-associated lipoprotein